jgi:hypothetical protein
MDLNVSSKNAPWLYAAMMIEKNGLLSYPPSGSSCVQMISLRIGRLGFGTGRQRKWP